VIIVKPKNLKSRIFLDGGSVDETKEVIKLLGFLDGQTTNPTLIAKNPEARQRIDRGEKFSETEIYDFYRGVVAEVSGLIPNGSVSVEVYADAETTAEAMIRQAREMFSWVPNAHVKFPTSREGLRAAERAIREGLRVNMTLCFTQEQAAAVYAATRGAKKGQVYVSPFVGRLDDRGENGMEVISNIIRMYRGGDGHVEVLTASVRTIDHLLYALKLGSDIVTVPYAVLAAWARDMQIPGESYEYNAKQLRPIPYRAIDLGKEWEAYDIRHELTDRGMERFSADWNTLIRKTRREVA
jgi:transaldolase